VTRRCPRHSRLARVPKSGTLSVPAYEHPREDEHQDMQELRDRLHALRERIAHVMVRL